MMTLVMGKRQCHQVFSRCPDRRVGPGIPREQREKIFERFYRAVGPQQKAIPGLGMGLYIVAEIVRRHGGTIVVDSEAGKGSTFTVTLPLKKDA